MQEWFVQPQKINSFLVQVKSVNQSLSQSVSQNHSLRDTKLYQIGLNPDCSGIKKIILYAMKWLFKMFRLETDWKLKIRWIDFLLRWSVNIDCSKILTATTSYHRIDCSFILHQFVPFVFLMLVEFLEKLFAPNLLEYDMGTIISPFSAHSNNFC